MPPVSTYEEYKSELGQLNRLEKLTDKATGIDNRLDLIARILLQQSKVVTRSANLEPPIIRYQKVTKHVVITQAASPLTAYEMYDLSPITGSIDSVTMEFPRGCDGLVQVAFRTDEGWIIPSNQDYLALNDKFPVFPLSNVGISKGDKLWLIVRNSDAINTHTITALIALSGVQYRQD